MQSQETGRKKRKRGEKRRKQRKGQNVALSLSREQKHMKLSADRTEEDKNLWFLWFHQHD